LEEPQSVTYNPNVGRPPAGINGERVSEDYVKFTMRLPTEFIEEMRSAADLRGISIRALLEVLWTSNRSRYLPGGRNGA